LKSGNLAAGLCSLCSQLDYSEGFDNPALQNLKVLMGLKVPYVR
jgi:hypothetical protein